MRTYIASSFSLQMCPDGGTLEVKKLSPIQDNAGALVETSYSRMGGEWANPTSHLDAHSIVGHEGTAKALSALLGVKVEVNREAIVLKPHDLLYVAQPTGERVTYGAEIDCPELSLFLVTLSQPLSEQDRADLLAGRAAREEREWQAAPPEGCPLSDAEQAESQRAMNALFGR